MHMLQQSAIHFNEQILLMENNAQRAQQSISSKRISNQKQNPKDNHSVQQFFILSMQNKELKKLVQNLSKQVQRLQSRAQNRQLKIAQLNRQKQESSVYQQELLAKVNQYAIIKERLSEQFDSLKRNIIFIQAQNKQKEKEITELKLKISQLIISYQQKVDDVKDLQHKLEEEQFKNGILEDDMANVEQKMSQMKIQLIERTFHFHQLARSIGMQQNIKPDQNKDICTNIKMASMDKGTKVVKKTAKDALIQKQTKRRRVYSKF